jgi:hypothetical protein
MKTDSKNSFGFAQMTDTIEQGYAGLDKARAAAIEGLLRIREARTRSLQRELEIARKNGDKSSVQQYEALAADNSRLVSSLQREATLANTPIPARKEDAAIVHGYVWQADNKQFLPAAKARVAVFQQQGAELGKQLAETKTNSDGYFKIAVPIKPTSGKGTTKKAGIGKATTDEQTGAETSGKTRVDPQSNGVVAVLAPSDKVPATAKSISLVANSLSFRELILIKDKKAGAKGKRRKGSP